MKVYLIIVITAILQLIPENLKMDTQDYHETVSLSYFDSIACEVVRCFENEDIVDSLNGVDLIRMMN